MKNKYDDPIFCINILYDFIYNRNKSSCYTLKQISKTDLILSNIKKTDDYDNTHIISLLQKSKLDHIESTRWYELFNCKLGEHNVLIRIGKYNTNNKNYNDLNRAEIIDMKINYLLSDMALTDVYPFIVLPIMNFDCIYKQIKEIKEIKQIKQIKDDDQMFVQILENYENIQTLHKFIDKNLNNMTINDWKVIVFQLIYILYKIGNKYQTFRHNKLNFDSIYLYNNVNINDRVHNCRVGSIVFTVPTLGYELKITNFYDAFIEDIADNNDIQCKKENLYYDVHYMFQSIINYFDDKKKKIPSELNSFIKQIIPEMFLSKNKNSIGLDEPYYEKNVTTILTPKLILTKNNFFTEFIKDNNMKNKSSNSSSNTSELSVSSVSNTPKNVKSYSMKESSVDYSITDQSSEDRSSRLFAKHKNNKNNKLVTGKRALGNKAYKFTEVSDISNITESSINNFNNKKLKSKYGKLLNKVNKLDSGSDSESGFTEKETPVNNFMRLFNEKVPKNNNVQNNTENNSMQNLTDGIASDFEGEMPAYMFNMPGVQQYMSGVQGLGQGPNMMQMQQPMPNMMQMQQSMPNIMQMQQPAFSSVDRPMPNMMSMQQPMPNIPGMSGLPGMPELPGMPGMPGFPGMPGLPGIPNMQSMQQNMPGMPGMPGMPSMPSMPGMPDIQQGKPLSNDILLQMVNNSMFTEGSGLGAGPGAPGAPGVPETQTHDFGQNAPDISSRLPAHLLLNNGNKPDMNNLGSASVGMNMVQNQMGGNNSKNSHNSKKSFFFLKGGPNQGK